MKRWAWVVLLCILLAIVIAVGSIVQQRAAFAMDGCSEAHRPPRIRPDYTQTVIPPNIAPLNFLVEEPGTHYRVTISSARGKPINIRRASPKIIIPPGPWRELLTANRGGKLRYDVYVRGDDGDWRRFETFTNTIAPEDIDGHLVYRLIRPLYNYWRDIRVYQRNLGNYDKRAVVRGRAVSNACVNCHTFRSNHTDRMAIGIRSAVVGSSALIAIGDSVTKMDTKFGYTSWHPNGRLVAYSLNKVHQFFHSAGLEVRDVVDLDSDVVYYQIGAPNVKTVAGLSDPDRLETYPTWSPEGDYLYFCSAPILWSNRKRVPPEHYEQVRYDLRRIPYDAESDTWGEVETVLSADETGKSILLPRISPDGRYVLFCMCDYGCFPIFQPSSDLYVMDLETREYRRLDINSDNRSESWHSWSSNGRWFAFSSKRRDGLFTRTYFSYFDEDGNAHKPLILPQKDPAFYDSFLKTYTVPELVVEPVGPSEEAFEEAAGSTQKVKVKMPLCSMTAKKGPQSSPWRRFRPDETAPSPAWQPGAPGHE